MKYFTFVLLVLAALALAGLVRVTMSHVDRNPETILEDARQSLDGPDPQYSRALTELDTALELSEARSRDRVTAEILLERGMVYKRMRSYQLARNDYMRLLDEFMPDDPKVRVRLLELDVHSGDFERGLKIADELLAEDPSNTQAWSNRGRILMRVAKQRVQECDALIDGAMPDDLSQQGKDLAAKLMGIDVDDPRRVSLQHKLRGLFRDQDDASARQVLRLTDLAGQESAQGREALARSLEQGIDRFAVQEYLSSLYKAGYHQEASDFGAVVSTFKEIAGFPDVMEDLMSSMTALGRADTAINLVEGRLSRRVLPSANFLATWCHTLAVAERWRELTEVAGNLDASGNAKQTALANFYLGMAYAERNNPRQSGRAFQDYLNSTQRPAPPLRDLAYVYRMFALRWESVGKLDSELESLILAVREDPDIGADVYRRLAEVLAQTDPDNLWGVEKAWTHAMRLSKPEIAAEIEPLWREAGELGLGQAGTSMQLLTSSLRRRGLCTPSVEAGPFELYRLMETYAQSGVHACAASSAERLLRDFEGFLPVIDTYIDASLALGEYETTASLLFKRMKRDGYDQRTLLKFDLLPAGTLKPDQKLELMRWDPGYTGRLIAVDNLRERGEGDRALEALSTLNEDDLRPEGRLLAARLLLDQERFSQAVSMLGPIGEDSPLHVQALQLKLRSAAMGSIATFQTALGELRSIPQVNLEELTGLVEDLWSKGRLAQALDLCHVLEQRDDIPDEDVLLHQGMSALLAGDFNLANESFQRAEAFDETGTALLGQILAAVEQRNWQNLPWLARELQASRFSTDLMGSTILAIFDERVDSAASVIEEGLNDLETEPLWALLDAAIVAMRYDPQREYEEWGQETIPATEGFLNGRPAGSRDPRAALAWVLALRAPGFARWNPSLWKSKSASRSTSLWPNYLGALAFRERGEPDRAVEMLRFATNNWPYFAPAWELWEDIEISRHGRFDHRSVRNIQRRRSRAVGQPTGDSEQALNTALALEKDGLLDEAIRKALDAVSADPQDAAARRKVAQLYEKSGQLREAMGHYRESLNDVPEDLVLDMVAEYLDFLERANGKKSDQVPRTTIAAELEILGRQYPNDPLIALARAKEELRTENLFSALRVQRAYTQLDTFRTLHMESSLEDLRPGATEDWVYFYAKLSPERAETFLREELGRNPGNLDFWILWGETLVLQERYEDAIEHFEIVLQILPDVRTRERLIALLSLYGEDLDRIEEHADIVRGIVGKKGTPEIDFYQARALINFPGDYRSQGIRLLDRLHQAPEEELGSLSHDEVSRLLGFAQLMRGNQKGRQMARPVLLTVGKDDTDPIRRDLTIAMTHLAKFTNRH